MEVAPKPVIFAINVLAEGAHSFAHKSVDSRQLMAMMGLVRPQTA
ncbi:hypothetical protein WKW79_31750 [Variovorax robiniae]|uniref:Uncharacterized protein n=1 Tax=Variovorax robiniae TaxID=1836199 RepID=A0ABU8XHV6_9BURK